MRLDLLPCAHIFASSSCCCLELFPPCGSPSISLIQLDLAIERNILVVEHTSSARDLCAYTDSYFKAKLLHFIKNKVLGGMFFTVPHHFDYWKSTRNLFTKESQASLFARNYLQVGLTGFFTPAWRWVEQHAHATSCFCEKVISPLIKAASNSNQGLFCSFCRIQQFGLSWIPQKSQEKEGKSNSISRREWGLRLEVNCWILHPFCKASKLLSWSEWADQLKDDCGLFYFCINAITKVKSPGFDLVHTPNLQK